MELVVIALVSAGLAAGAYLGWRLRHTLGELNRGLESLGRGGRPRFVMTGDRWPARRLARTFNSVATEIQAQVARLDQDRQQLLVVLGAMEEAVVAVDQRHRLLFANASANQLFGLDASSVGRLVPELIRSPHVQDAVEASLRLASPTAFNGEVMLTSWEAPARSHQRVLSVRGTPLPGGPSSGAVLVFHDVSELRRLERTRQDFVANASHELKTPLASIKAFTETLLDWALHDESVNVRFLERIDEQAMRLNQLILDLLSLARLESGEAGFDHRPHSLIPILEPCVEAHRGRAETKNLRLSFEPGDVGEEIQVFADDEAIRQIVDNLVDNAIKYTPEGGSVRVSCYADGNTVSIEVADTGIGIPREDLPRIFERFYRVDKARSRELGGTGLGLSIVKHLMQSIGGQIDVTSRAGSGSKFTVELPRCLVSEMRSREAVR
jgi:two-component system phosphate regulon sensor histidine kinase PhoR